VTIEFRVLTSADDLAVLPDFEQLIWGGDDDRVSVNMLVATITEGGVAVAAFDDGCIVGSAYGFATREPDVLHSHYLAVHPDYRAQGLGEQIKREQAAWCAANGYTSMRWTFDPLQLTNAHLNLNKLGAVGIHYHVNHYGVTVQWFFAIPPPVISETFVLDVPPVTPAQIAASEPEAFTARLAVRNAMLPHIEEGWRVVGVDRQARTYTLGR
jgi:predicted GNAT superfamily acetyltransferase